LRLPPNDVTAITVHPGEVASDIASEQVVVARGRLARAHRHDARLVRVRRGLTDAAALNAAGAAAHAEVLLLGAGSAEEAAAVAARLGGDERVAAARDGGLTAIRADLFRARPFRWDLTSGEIEEWAAHWTAHGWGTDGVASADPPSPPPPPAVAVFADRYPQLSETFVAGEARALRRAGHAVHVEARGRLGDADARFASDETRAQRLVALAWLVARHPLRAARDLVTRRRWAREERVTPLRQLAPRARRLAAAAPALHLHAHFAYEAALDALRIGRLLGVPVSVTAHAADIYRDPRNLRDKLLGAHFATSGCDATVADLRALAGAGHAGGVVKVIMGVDLERFRRSAPHPGGRQVVAVGRLVEKKGFIHLVRAAARAEDLRVTILGEGSERAALEAEVARLGLAGRVLLPGAAAPEAVRAALESADLLCAPSVIARDGDRDSMPVVVKEALAMEVCVVASALVGLPEIVREPWGRQVPPGDEAALAEAIEALLARPVEERAAAGRAGRAFVAEHANADAEAAKLSSYIRAAQAARAH
jgi:glycosyltransferase involved in cell wall biosynthesis